MRLAKQGKLERFSSLWRRWCRPLAYAPAEPTLSNAHSGSNKWACTKFRRRLIRDLRHSLKVDKRPRLDLDLVILFSRGCWGCTLRFSLWGHFEAIIDLGHQKGARLIHENERKYRVSTQDTTLCTGFTWNQKSIFFEYHDLPLKVFWDIALAHYYPPREASYGVLDNRGIDSKTFKKNFGFTWNQNFSFSLNKNYQECPGHLVLVGYWDTIKWYQTRYQARFSTQYFLRKRQWTKLVWTPCTKTNVNISEFLLSITFL